MLIRLVIISAFICFCFGQDAYISKCGELERCKEKIVINKTFINLNRRNTEYIKIHKVVDREKGKIFTLINPVLVRIYSSLPRLVYPMKLVNLVNRGAYEVFYHKENMENYQGCNDIILNQLCGENMKGYCCSCDGSKDNLPYHIRGGQDCDTNNTSVHCLRYDPVWYSVNELNTPSLHHTMLVSIVNTDNNKVTSITVGTSHPTSQDDLLYVKYSVNHVIRDRLDYQHKVLLIPQTNNSDVSQIMLVKKFWISKDETECDKIGVSIQAFNNQPDRCHRYAQSCLENQPIHFWLKDMEKNLKRKTRKYFLEDRYKDAPKIIKSEKSQWSIAVPVTIHPVSLEIQVVADDIGMIPKQFKHIMRECVYTDNSQSEALYILLFNQGYQQESLSIQLQSCNVSVTGELHTTVQLLPRTSHNIQLIFHTGIVTGTFQCTLFVTAESDEIDGDKWEITLQKQHQCICYPQYSCTCGTKGYHRHITLSSHGMFRGPTDPTFVLWMFFIFLLILGFIKALLSLWSPITVGEFGLCLFTRSKIVLFYQEILLSKYEVIYNERGIPVHPVTKEPVQILSKSELFVINLCFGFYLLFIGLHWLILKLSGLDMKYKLHREEKSWHQKLISPVTSHVDSSSHDTGAQNTHISDGSYETNWNAKVTLYGMADKQLVYEQYRKQKKEIEKSKQIKNLLTEKGDASPKRRNKSRTVKGKARSLNKKLPIQDILQMDHVFFNYQRNSPLLKMSGNCYSLCGILKRYGRRYRFELGPYSYQMCENIDGTAQKLLTPRKIIHPVQFITELNTSAVHQYITTEPLFPCLNTLITFSNHT